MNKYLYVQHPVTVSRP